MLGFGFGAFGEKSPQQTRKSTGAKTSNPRGDNSSRKSSTQPIARSLDRNSTLFRVENSGTHKECGSPCQHEALISKNILFALSQEIDQNIVIDPNVNKQAAVDLKNVTLEEALDNLLPPLRL